MTVKMDRCFICGKWCYLFGCSNMCWDCFVAKDYKELGVKEGKKEYSEFVPPSVIKIIEHSREKRKNEIISKLRTIQNDSIMTYTYQQWIDQVIEFIKEGNE